MKNIVAIFAVVLFVSLFFISLPDSVYADMINPRYLKKCKPYEKEAVCHWEITTFLGKSIKTGDCGKYEYNFRFKFLQDIEGFLRGTTTYCYKPIPASTITSFFYHLKLYSLLFTITLLSELLIFFLLGFRKKKAIIAILIANLISTLLLYIATLLLLYTLGTLFILELAVIIFESLFIVYRLKGVDPKKIISVTIIANIFSIIVGLILTHIISFL